MKKREPVFGIGRFDQLLPALFIALIISLSLGFSTVFADPYITYKNVFLFGWISVFLVFIMAFTRVENFRPLLLGSLSIMFLLAHGFFISWSQHRPFNITALASDSALVILVFAWIKLLEMGGDAYGRVISWNGICSFLVASIGLAQYVGFETTFLPAGQGPISTVANINMVAQYLICSIALLLAHEGRSLQGWRRWGRLFAVSCLISYIMLIMCRSAIIGLALLLGYLAFFRIYKKREVTFLIASTAFVVTIILMISKHGTDPLAPIIQSKMQHSSGRTFLWQHSWDLIQDYVWGGIGRGNFEMLSSPYMLSAPSVFAKEGMVIDTPHNEIIQIIAELGLPLGVFTLGTIGFILARAFFLHLKARRLTRSDILPCMALGLVLGPEILFQFPLKLPFSILFISLFIALFYQSYPRDLENRLLRSPLLFKMQVAVLAIFFAWQTTRYFQAERVFHDGQARVEDLQLACEQVPENWRVCLRLQYERIRQGQIAEVLAYAQQFLAANPGFYLVERLRIEATMHREPLASQCEAVRQYKRQFQSVTSLDRYADLCSEISQQAQESRSGAANL